MDLGIDYSFLNGLETYSITLLTIIGTLAALAILYLVMYLVTKDWEK